MNSLRSIERFQTDCPLPCQNHVFSTQISRYGSEVGSAVRGSNNNWRTGSARWPDAPPFLELPTDGPRRPARSSKGALATSVIPKALTARLKQLGQQEGASLFMVLLAAYQVLLYRCSGQSDVVVGSAISSRELIELENVVGLFVNTLPLRIDLSGNPPFRRVLSRVREMVLEAHLHQDIPFETLVRELRPPRASGRNPHFSGVSSRFEVGSATGRSPIASSQVISSESAKFDLSLSVEEFSDGMRAEIEYSADLFRRDRMVDVLERLTRLLESIADSARSRS